MRLDTFFALGGGFLFTRHGRVPQPIALFLRRLGILGGWIEAMRLFHIVAQSEIYDLQSKIKEPPGRVARSSPGSPDSAVFAGRGGSPVLA